MQFDLEGEEIQLVSYWKAQGKEESRKKRCLSELIILRKEAHERA